MKFSTRLKIALQISKLGSWGESIALGIMKEENLIEWNRYFAEQVAAKRGPLTFERMALSKAEADCIYPAFKQPGTALVLGSGEGRESIALSLQGWTVTGLEDSKKLLIEAETHANNMNLSIDFICRDVSQGLPGFTEPFDLICLMGQIFSYVPTTTKRINLLKNAKGLLKENGRIILNMPMLEVPTKKMRSGHKQRLFFAKLTNGYKSCELGDHWDIKHEYYHKYPLFEDFEREVRTAGLQIDEEPSNHELVALIIPR